MIENMSLEQLQEIQKVKFKKERRTSDIILAVLFVTTLIIVGLYFYCILVVGIEPTTIVQVWFQTVLGELGILGVIKSVKEWRKG